MTTDRKPRPSDLLDARAISNEFGVAIRVAENIFSAVARAHGGPVEFLDDNGNALVRKIFVRREWVESSIGQRT